MRCAARSKGEVLKCSLGAWSTQTLECFPVECKAFGELGEAFVATGASTLAGATRTIACAPGFTAASVATVEVVCDGVAWSDWSLECVEEACPDLVLGPEYRVLGQGTQSGGTCLSHSAPGHEC